MISEPLKQQVEVPNVGWLPTVILSQRTSMSINGWIKSRVESELAGEQDTSRPVLSSPVRELHAVASVPRAAMLSVAYWESLGLFRRWGIRTRFLQ